MALGVSPSYIFLAITNSQIIVVHKPVTKGVNRYILVASKDSSRCELLRPTCHCAMVYHGSYVVALCYGSGVMSVVKLCVSMGITILIALCLGLGFTTFVRYGSYVSRKAMLCRGSYVSRRVMLRFGIYNIRKVYVGNYVRQS